MATTDYFTKWVEAVPLQNVATRDVIDFVREHILYRFGIPQMITTDQGTMFTSAEFQKFLAGLGIKLLNSSPYYAQANGQAEAKFDQVDEEEDRRAAQTMAQHFVGITVVVQDGLSWVDKGATLSAGLQT